MKKIILLFLPFLFVLFSCDSYDRLSEDGIYIHDGFVDITSSVAIGAIKGNSATITIKSSGNWSIKSDSKWLSVSPNEGDPVKETNIIIEAEENNPIISTRVAHLTIISGDYSDQCTVTQNAGGAPTITNFTRERLTMKFNFKVSSEINVKEAGVYYSDGENTYKEKASLQQDDGSYLAIISNFSHGKNYKVQAYADNGVKEVMSSDDITVDTKIGFEFSHTGDLTFQINPTCSVAIDKYGICYTTTDGGIPFYNANDAINHDKNGNAKLSPDTSGKGYVYTVRAWAKNDDADDVGYSDDKMINSNIKISIKTIDGESSSSKATISWECTSDLSPSESGVKIYYKEGGEMVEKDNGDKKANYDKNSEKWSVELEKEKKDIYINIYADNISGRYYYTTDSSKYEYISASTTPGKDDNPRPDKPL